MFNRSIFKRNAFNRNMSNSKRGLMQVCCALSGKAASCIAVLAVAALAQSPASGPGWDMIGQNQDNSALAASGVISYSKGSFDSATGMKCEGEVQCPNFQCPKSPTCSGQSSNEFTLQLNTNSFRAARCNNAPSSSCMGEEQFVFTNSQCQTDDFYPHSPSKACVYIEYWLQGYGTRSGCPSPFKLTDKPGYCVVNSTNYTPVPPQVLTNSLLESLQLTGEVAPAQLTLAGEPVKVTGQVTQDKVTLTIGSTSYSALGDNIFPELGSSPNSWTFSEFNIFGDGHGSQAVFNSGTTLLVRTAVNSGTTSAPRCNGSGNTLESNNLSLLGTCSQVGGPSPAIVFPESLASGHQGSTALLYDANDGQADVVGFGSNGNQSMDYPNISFRSSWSSMAAGNFINTSGNPQQVVLYDQTAGQADVVAFESSGKAGPDFQNPGIGTSFDKMVAGYFTGNGREQVLLYNSNTGEADVVGFNTDGTKNLDYKNINFGNWDTILPGAFLTNGQQEQVFVYNRKAGHAAIVTFDSGGKASPPVLNTGFRTSWDLLVAGHFIGNGRSDRPAGVVLYDRAAGEVEVVGFDTKGGVISYPTNRGFRTTWTQMVAGDFIQDARDQILLYDQNAGDADVVAFDTKGGESLDYTNHGFRTTWTQMFTAPFIGNVGEIGPEQVLLYDGNSGEVDVVGFDKNAPQGKAILDGQNSRYRGSSDIIAVGALVPN